MSEPGGGATAFSVLVPARNAEGTIRKTLRSVFIQSEAHWELIVVNDGSDDGTREIVEELARTEPRLSLINIDHAGVSAARNTGLRAAKGVCVLFLDADDWISPFYLERARGLFERDVSLDAVYCRWGYVTGLARVEETLDQPEQGALFPALARSNPFVIHGCIVKTDVVRSIDGFDETMAHAEDWDFWQRLARTGANFGFLGDLLAFYRIRGDSTSTDAYPAMSACVEVVRRGHGPDQRVHALDAYPDGMPSDQLPGRLLSVLAWFAGIAIGQRQDPQGLLPMIADGRLGDYDPEDIANTLANGLLRSLALPLSGWPKTYSKYKGVLRDFLVYIGQELAIAGFARSVDSYMYRRSLEDSFLGKAEVVTKNSRRITTFEPLLEGTDRFPIVGSGRLLRVWGMTALFNMNRSARGLQNYHMFRARLRQQGLRLATVEVAFAQDPFVLNKDDADMLIQLRSDALLWHKERALNILMQSLPDECRSVVWLDSDVLFENEMWVEDTLEVLGEYKVVQPFAYAVRLPPDAIYFDPRKSHYPRDDEDGDRHHSFGFGWIHFGQVAQQAYPLLGHPGYAWAARRELLEDRGLYDTSVIAGAGDILTAQAFIGHDIYLSRFARWFSTQQLARYNSWAESVYRDVRGNVGYVPGTLFHLWHGYQHDRAYDRWTLEVENQFDPSTDIAVDENGLYRWATKKGALADAVERYMVRRAGAEAVRKALFRPISGAYDDEGKFRWCSRDAVLEVTRAVEPATFSIASNVIESLERKQIVRVFVNGKYHAEVVLDDNSPRAVSISRVHVGDRIRLMSDFDFRPSDLGSHDSRILSFMLMY